MIETMLLSIIGGILIISSLGPLGCIALWQRTSYLGDAISHSSILGIVLGIGFNIDVTLSIIITSIVFSISLIILKNKAETLISILILSYGFLALGLFLLPFAVTNMQIDISSYLFGDILLITTEEIILMGILSCIALCWIYFRWKKIVITSINQDLAFVEGINTKRINLECTLITATIIGVSIKILGILLVASMLAIPAASARNTSKLPSQMLRRSVIYGTLSIIIGMILSYQLDAPSGPSITIAALALFIASITLKKNEA